MQLKAPPLTDVTVESRNKRHMGLFNRYAALILWAVCWYALPSSSAAAHPVCNDSLWQHVYHPYRLKVLKRCISVAGVIENVRSEKDGDYHIRLRLDPRYTHLLNQGNRARQHGDLVIEPVCEYRVTQADAKDACHNFSSHLKVPPAGTHVRVTGSYVLDKDHGWMEIHPATRIEATGKKTASQSGGSNIRVWVNIHSGVYHCKDSRWYGKTKHGQYMSEQRAEAEGYHAAYGQTCR